MKRELEQLPSIQEVPFNPFLPPPQKIKAPDTTPISSIGKIAPKQGISPVSFKPELKAPAFIRQALRSEEIKNRQEALFQKNIQNNLDLIGQLEKEMLVKIQESAEKTQNQNSWKSLQQIAALLLASINTVIGTYFITSTSAPFVGAAMLTAGLLEISDIAGAWDSVATKIAGSDDELQKKIRALFRTSIGLISGLLAFGGTTRAALFHSLNLSQKVFSIGETAFYLTRGTLMIGAGVSESQMKFVDAALSEIKAKTQDAKYHMEISLKQMEEFCEFMTKFIEDTSLLVKATLNTIQSTQQPV